MRYDTQILSDNFPVSKLLIDCLQGKNVRRSPFWFMRQAGRYMPEYREVRKNFPDFLSMCYTPQAAVEVTMQPVEKFNTDAAILFSDILVVPDALGIDVEFVEKKGPVLSALRSGDDLTRLSIDKISTHLAPVYEAVTGIKSRLEADKALIGFTGAPWTIACYMIEGEGSRDFPLTRKTAYSSPEWFYELIEILSEATAQHLLLQIKSGADTVQLFDSWAGILSEAEYKKWVIDPTRKIVMKMKQEYPDILIIGYPRGSGVLYEKYVIESGVDAVAIDERMPLEWVKKYLQPHVVVQGNLDPLLLAGDKERSLMRAREINSLLGSGSFVFNLGHGIIPSTPVENVRALSEMLLDYNPDANKNT